MWGSRSSGEADLRNAQPARRALRGRQNLRETSGGNGNGNGNGEKSVRVIVGLVSGKHASGVGEQHTYVVRVDEEKMGRGGGYRGREVLAGDKLTRVGSVALLIRMRLHHLRPTTLRPGQESPSPQIHPDRDVHAAMRAAGDDIHSHQLSMADSR